jgi:hypothetical protein
MDQVADDLIALIDEWPNWFPASPRDIERGEELFGGGYTWTLQGEDGPKRYKYRAGRWHRIPEEATQIGWMGDISGNPFGPSDR